MDAESRDLERPTKTFALRILAFVAGFPKTRVSDAIGHEKEASETCYWLELCEEASIGDTAECQWLLKESSELLALFTRIGKTTKSRCRKPRS